jgi:TLC domain
MAGLTQAFSAWCGSWSSPPPEGESISIYSASQRAQLPRDTLFVTERWMHDLGLGWLLNEEGESIPGTTNVASDLTMVVAGAVFLTAARWLFQKQFARWWLSNGFGNAHPSNAGEGAEGIEIRAGKASESAWKTLFYAPIYVICVFSVWHTPWWANTRLAFVGWPYMPISPLLKVFFLGELAFYVHSTFAHFTIEAVRSDFVAMAVHHILTTALIALAFFCNYHRTAGILLILFDIGDALLESGKVLLYAGWEKTSTVMIGVLIAIWWWMRVLFWAFKLGRTSLVHSVSVIGADVMPGHAWGNLFLFTLWLLNIWWGFLITRIAVKKVMGGTLVDTREKKEKKKEK